MSDYLVLKQVPSISANCGKSFKMAIRQVQIIQIQLFSNVQSLPFQKELRWILCIFIVIHLLHSAICSCFRGRGIDYLAKERDNNSVLQASEEQWSVTPGTPSVCRAVIRQAKLSAACAQSYNHSALRIHCPCSCAGY